MRLQKYLTEKFLDGIRVNSHDYEVFKNPTKKELKELDSGFGYRFYIDAKKKNIYFANADIFHRDMLKSAEMTRELGFTFSRWSKYWNGTDEAIARIFMGDCDSKLDNVNSDVLSDFVSEGRTEALPMLYDLVEHDYNWVSKYGMDPNDIKKEISTTIELLEEKI